MKRSPIRPKRATPRQRIAPKEDFGWWEDATQILLTRCHGLCEHCGADLHQTGIERHHRVRRRDGGDTLANLLALCPKSHRHITENPAEAYANGWMVRALTDEDPAHVPVRIAGYWWLLDNTGRKSLVP